MGGGGGGRRWSGQRIISAASEQNKIILVGDPIPASFQFFSLTFSTVILFSKAKAVTSFSFCCFPKRQDTSTWVRVKDQTQAKTFLMPPNSRQNRGEFGSLGVSQKGSQRVKIVKYCQKFFREGRKNLGRPPPPPS